MADDIKESPLAARLADFCRDSLSIGCVRNQRANIDDGDLKVVVP
jgi:hypothetical protein